MGLENTVNGGKMTNKDAVNKDRSKALEMAISQIEKNFGKGAIMRLGAEEIAEGIQVIPTGSLTLDIATGIGGFPRGRVVEIFGPESSGKTTLALNAIAQAQMSGGAAAFIDAEHALDITYAQRTRRQRSRPPRVSARHGRTGT